MNCILLLHVDAANNTLWELEHAPLDEEEEEEEDFGGDGPGLG